MSNGVKGMNVEMKIDMKDQIGTQIWYIHPPPLTQLTHCQVKHFDIDFSI